MADYTYTETLLLANGKTDMRANLEIARIIEPHLTGWRKNVISDFIESGSYAACSYQDSIVQRVIRHERVRIGKRLLWERLLAKRDG